MTDAQITEAALDELERVAPEYEAALAAAQNATSNKIERAKANRALRKADAAYNYAFSAACRALQKAGSARATLRRNGRQTITFNSRT